MSSPFEAPGERDAERDLAVSDPEDYLVSRRFRRIMDAREQVSETIRERKDDIVDDPRKSGITQSKYRELVADAIVEYLIEVEPILRHDDLAEDVDVWGEPVATDPDDESITPKRIVDEGGVVPDGNGEMVPLPVNVSRAAYRTVNRFLAEIGFGVPVDRGLPVDGDFDATRHRGRERDSDAEAEA